MISFEAIKAVSVSTHFVFELHIIVVKIIRIGKFLKIYLNNRFIHKSPKNVSFNNKK